MFDRNSCENYRQTVEKSVKVALKD